MTIAGMEIVRILQRAAWQTDAACRGMDPALWYPERGADTDPAKEICAHCPVRADCAEAGRPERFGIWGGLTERQRRRHRRVEGIPTYFHIRHVR